MANTDVSGRTKENEHHPTPDRDQLHDIIKSGMVFYELKAGIYNKVRAAAIKHELSTGWKPIFVDLAGDNPYRIQSQDEQGQAIKKLLGDREDILLFCDNYYVIQERKDSMFIQIHNSVLDHAKILGRHQERRTSDSYYPLKLIITYDDVSGGEPVVAVKPKIKEKKKAVVTLDTILNPNNPKIFYDNISAEEYLQIKGDALERAESKGWVPIVIDLVGENHLYKIKDDEQRKGAIIQLIEGKGNIMFLYDNIYKLSQKRPNDLVILRNLQEHIENAIDVGAKHRKFVWTSQPIPQEVDYSKVFSR